MDKICICGGGNVGHTLAGVLAARSDTEVYVLTRRPGLWDSKISIIENSGNKIVGKLNTISSAPKDVISKSDIIIVALPSYAVPPVLKKISVYVKKDTWIGSFPGTGGFDWMVKDTLGKNHLIFGTQRVPYICRTKTYGKEALLLGRKKEIRLASIPNTRASEVSERLQHLLEMSVIALDNFLAVTLTPSNPILHPSRLYGMFRDWEPGKYFGKETFFYRDWDVFSSEILLKCDAELQQVCSRIPLDLSGVLSLLQHYDVKNKEELTAKISSIDSLKNIKAPMVPTKKGFVPDVESRYFREDIPYGLLIIRAIAELISYSTPTIDTVLYWAQKLMKKEYLVDGSLDGRDIKETHIPQRYNIKSVDELVRNVLDKTD